MKGEAGIADTTSLGPLRSSLFGDADRRRWGIFFAKIDLFYKKALLPPLNVSQSIAPLNPMYLNPLMITNMMGF